jgi:hypothetical protein
MTDKAYRDRIKLSKERLDAAIRSDAKRFGHHGPANLVETVRQRHNAALDPDYAADLCRTLAGWKG